MLKFFRNSLNGVAVKVLMGLLALTFVLWGVGDTLRQRSVSYAFKVGDHTFSESEFSRELAREVHKFQMESGRSLSETNEEDQRLINKIKISLVKQLVNRSMFIQEAREMGLVVNDEMVKIELANMSMFQKDGKFNKVLFESFLANNGMTESMFIALMKEDIAVSALDKIFQVNQLAPALMVSNMIKAANSTRYGRLVSVDSAQLSVDAPSTEQFESFYNSNARNYLTDEQRELSYVTFGLEQVNLEQEISDELLMQQYEERKMSFNEPEKRKVLHLFFKDEAKAKEIAGQLAGGKSFTEAAKALHSDQKDFNMGEITRASFDSSITEEIFSVNKGKATGVVKSPLGFHIFYVESIKPEIVKSFEQVKATLKKQLIDEQKHEVLNKMAGDIDSKISQGQALAQLAKEYNFKVSTIKATTTSDAPVMGQSSFFPQIKSAGFSLEPNAVSQVMPVQDQNLYMIVEASSVIPSAPKPYDSVKVQVQKDYVQDAKNKQVSVLLDSVLKAKNDELHDILRNKALVVNSYKYNPLDDRPQIQDKDLQQLIIGMATSQIKPYAKGGSVSMVAILDRVEKEGADVAPTDVAMIKSDLSKSIPFDFQDSYIKYLFKKYKVDIRVKAD
jgi:peptidyl-prolyl cis-trans isomerase D